MQRISVIGCPGAGKSVFSARLHSITGLPLVYLDTLYHNPKHSGKDNRADWLKSVSNVVKGKEWIIDGDFVDTFDIRFRVSDTIIFLDFPTVVCLVHAITRRLAYHHHPRLEMPKHWKERLPLEFIGYILTYRKNERPKVITSIDNWRRSNQVITFRTLRQAERYLRHLQQS